MSVEFRAPKFLTAVIVEEPFDSHPARYWHKLDDGRIQCDLCLRFCRLA